MYKKLSLDNRPKLHIVANAIKALATKESFIGLYFLLFILGITAGSEYGVYNESRIAEVVLLLGLCIYSYCCNHYLVTKVEWLFFAFVILGSFFWSNALFLIADLLLIYLLYKSFYWLEYRPVITKIIVFASFLFFLLLPVALWDYIATGTYSTEWYPLRLNIRIYNSYLLIISIFAVWLYLTENSYKNVYLGFLSLAFLSILIDGGRSATLAYSAFITMICLFNRSARWQLLAAYAMSWFTYLAISYLAALHAGSTAAVQIVRATTSQRYDIWMDALKCWSQSPILGCGFYQLDSDRTLAAHPHNIFLQALSEIGLIGFGFLLVIIFVIAKNISWNLKQNYFVIAALLAISIELSLSGIHIYPITQIALLWLFVFLLKSPDFLHAKYFSRVPAFGLASHRFLSIASYLLLAGFFIYIFITTTALIDNELMTRPRFLENGYKIF
ncbi:O-antigen ligase family protein [Psychrobacter sp. ANT_WB68]|uniref:O-antigen ligase family protein n=1 Tax=Psychrobacter sp. ANT_WB68 TaxID=2597355 RepID=UPI0011F1453E|nr:O-antigen ligase family protein [Psychrobacter sp. ANT_WB68]KAA0913666.1 O-antigen ligase family protein [Psychrobacter sp. ANT_WB68]